MYSVCALILTTVQQEAVIFARDLHYEMCKLRSMALDDVHLTYEPIMKEFAPHVRAVSFPLVAYSVCQLYYRFCF